MDYESIIHAIVDPFVNDKEAIMIREMPSENPKDVLLLIVANSDDTARMIGRKGTIADSLRELISVAGKTENKRIHLKFESFTVENKDED